MSGVSQNPADVRARMKQGQPGRLVYTDPTVRRGDGINSGGQVAQVATITVDTATDSAVYTFTINGVTLTFTNGTSSTTTTVAVLLAATINAEPLVRGQVQATAAVAIVTITAKTPGTRGAFTASDADSKLTTAESATAAADASAIPFGVALITTGYSPAPAGSGLANTERLVASPKTTLFTAQVITASYTFVASNVVQGVVYERRGGERKFVASAIFVSATDVATSTTGLVAALNTALPANTVDVTGTSTIILTSEILGYEFEFELNHNSGGASSPVFTITLTTGPSVATSLHRAFVGVSEYSLADESATITATTGSYAANAGVIYVLRGVVWVTNSETTGPTQSGDVYVEMAAGATQGQLYAASSATRIALSRHVAKWERDGLVTADNLSALRLEAA